MLVVREQHELVLGDQGARRVADVHVGLAFLDRGERQRFDEHRRLAEREAVPAVHARQHVGVGLAVRRCRDGQRGRGGRQVRDLRGVQLARARLRRADAVGIVQRREREPRDVELLLVAGLDERVVLLIVVRGRQLEPRQAGRRELGVKVDLPAHDRVVDDVVRSELRLLGDVKPRVPKQLRIHLGQQLRFGVQLASDREMPHRGGSRRGPGASARDEQRNRERARREGAQSANVSSHLSSPPRGARIEPCVRVMSAFRARRAGASHLRTGSETPAGVRARCTHPSDSSAAIASSVTGTAPARIWVVST